jgi:DNA-binding NarL/FixJ family response regulator
MDAAGGFLLYHGFMKRVYLADAQTEERSALRLMLLDLDLQVVGEASDWPTALAQVPATRPDMVVVDWDLVAEGSGAAHSTNSAQALAELRVACPAAVVIVLISHLDARQQAALSAGADAFISKSEMPDRVAERLRAAAGTVTTCEIHKSL